MLLFFVLDRLQTSEWNNSDVKELSIVVFARTKKKQASSYTVSFILSETVALKRTEERTRYSNAPASCTTQTDDARSLSTPCEREFR